MFLSEWEMIVTLLPLPRFFWESGREINLPKNKMGGKERLDPQGGIARLVGTLMLRERSKPEVAKNETYFH